MDRLKIALTEFPITDENSGDCALVQVDDGPSEIYFWHNYFMHPVPLDEFLELSRRAAETGVPVLTANFDFTKIRDIVYKTPIFLDERTEVNGSIEYYGGWPKFGQERERCIRIKQRGDSRTLFHEICHLCGDIPLNLYRFYSNEERVVEIATEVAIRNGYAQLLEIIKRKSVDGAIELFGLAGVSREQLEGDLDYFACYPGERDRFSERQQDLFKYFFLDELKQRLK